jgi:hypothetical protein
MSWLGRLFGKRKRDDGGKWMNTLMQERGDGFAAARAKSPGPDRVYATMGLSTPWHLNDELDLMSIAPGDPSAAGYELTMATPEFTDWPIRILNVLLLCGMGAWSGRSPGTGVHEVGERIPLRPMGMQFPGTAIEGLITQEAPFREHRIATRSGQIELIHLLGITKDEYAWLVSTEPSLHLAAISQLGLVTDFRSNVGRLGKRISATSRPGASLLLSYSPAPSAWRRGTRIQPRNCGSRSLTNVINSHSAVWKPTIAIGSSGSRAASAANTSRNPAVSIPALLVVHSRTLKVACALRAVRHPGWSALEHDARPVRTPSMHSSIAGLPVDSFTRSERS